MVFSSVFLLASVFRRVVGRRRRIHPIPQGCGSYTLSPVKPGVTRGKECGMVPPRRSEEVTEVCECEDLLETVKSKLGGSNESKISKKHNILLGSKAETGKIITKSGKNEHQNGRPSLSLEKRMESFWSDKSLIEREYFAHEYGPENGGRTDTWKGLYRHLENQMVFQDPGLELYINPQCHIRNRYKTVLPYVKNRVKLSGGGNDYINASYISVEEVERSYIVTQGPLGNTIRHFWEMAWEHRSTGIVMLCEENVSKKCAQYWPKEVHGRVIAGYFMVECHERTGCDSYTVSSLEIQNLETQETHSLLHFHYNSWPDFGVPQNEAAFVRFLLAVRNSGVLGPNVGPAIVHCSAGVGRSGVFTLVDVCLSFIERSGTLDGLNVNDILLDLRMQRLGLVQTSEQLKFSYLAILNAAHTTLGLGQNTEDFKKEVEHEMVKEVEDEMVGCKAPIELPMPKLVFVRPFSQSQQKPLYFASMPLTPPNSPKSLSASLPSIYSDTDSIHTLTADSTTADQKCVPTPTSFTHTETVETNTATTCLAVSST